MNLYIYISRFIQYIYIYKVSKNHRKKTPTTIPAAFFCGKKTRCFHGWKRPSPPRLADQQREVWARSLDSSFQHILRRYGGTGPKRGKCWNHGYEQMDDLGGKKPYFWKHPYITKITVFWTLEVSLLIAPNIYFTLRIMAIVNLPPPDHVPPPEIAGLMIRAYENPLVSLNKAGY